MEFLGAGTGSGCLARLPPRVAEKSLEAHESGVERVRSPLWKQLGPGRLSLRPELALPPRVLLCLVGPKESPPCTCQSLAPAAAIVMIHTLPGTQLGGRRQPPSPGESAGTAR